MRVRHLRPPMFSTEVRCCEKILTDFLISSPEKRRCIEPHLRFLLGFFHCSYSPARIDTMSSVVHLEMEPYAGSIDLKDTALVIIDMQVRTRQSAQRHCLSHKRSHNAVLERGIFWKLAALQSDWETTFPRSPRPLNRANACWTQPAKLAC